VSDSPRAKRVSTRKPVARAQKRVDPQIRETPSQRIERLLKEQEQYLEREEARRIYNLRSAYIGVPDTYLACSELEATAQMEVREEAGHQYIRPVSQAMIERGWKVC
jgi:hypothetical protein